MPQTPAGNIGLEFEHTIGVDDWKNSYDANWLRLDSLSGQAFVVNSELLAEPGAPSVGDGYILPAGSKTGTNWGSDSGVATHSIALFTNLPGQTDGSPWLYIVPRDGWFVYDRTNTHWLRFNGTIWIIFSLQSLFLELGDNGGDYTLTLEENENMTLSLGDPFDDVNDSIVIPNNSTEAFPRGTWVRIINRSGGQVNVIDEGSVVWEGRDLSADKLPDDCVVMIQKVQTNVWKILDYQTNGTHTSDVTGWAADPSIAFTFARKDNLVTLRWPVITGTSDATTKNLATNLPEALRPLSPQTVFISADDGGGAATHVIAVAVIGTDGNIDFFVDIESGAWNASGAGEIAEGTAAYNLT